MEAKKERLQVILARLGYGSRRNVVRLIEEGAVSINGKIIMEKGFRCDPEKDHLEVFGKPINLQSLSLHKRYFLLNKPCGVTTTVSDPFAQKTVLDFFREIPERIFPVGRLDKDTSGLLLLTNDGELAFRLTHPRFGVIKKYYLIISAEIDKELIKAIENGVEIGDGHLARAKVEVISRRKGQSEILLTLQEGKKREIRLIFKKLHIGIKLLQRVQFGPLSLGNLKPGQWRELLPEEVNRLKKSVGL